MRDVLKTVGKKREKWMNREENVMDKSCRRQEPK